jgi:acyl-CoA reductase-like NAD-dependent aldehyde dehydrogenase
MKKQQNYIDGRWCDADSGQVIHNVNPATGKTIALYPRSSSADIETAINSARRALPEWRKMPAPARGAFLYDAAGYLKEHIRAFGADVCSEMGKTLKESIGDIQESIDMAKFCAGEGRRNLGMVTSSEDRDRFVLAYREPLGVAGAITPWNYPMAMPAWKIMPALITGNTVVLKPAEDTPQSAINLAKAFEAAGLPPGVLNVVVGTGEEAGAALVDQPGVDIISFTGSTEVGRSIAAKCAARNKRVALEMGGKNAVIVLADADLDSAVRGILRSVFATAGQRCSSAGRIIAEGAVVDELTAALVDAAGKLKLGNGMSEDTEIGPLINAERLASVENKIEIAREAGAHILCGGERAAEGDLKNGFFYKPTLISSVAPDMPIAQEETFGPVASILPVRDVAHAVEVANDIDYGLTASVYTRNIDKAMIVSREIEVGAFFINTACVGAEIHLPFGGRKGSGNGRREGAHHMLDIYTEWKSVSIKYDSASVLS